MECRNKRKDYLDLAKGIGIILVVFGHVNIPEEVHRAIFMFHMPLFLIISGMLFRRKALLFDIKKQLIHIVVPLLLFSIVFVPVQVIKDKYGMLGGLPYCGIQLMDFHYSINNRPLWYLKVLLLLYLFTYSIDYIRTKNTVVAIAISIITVVGSYVLCSTKLSIPESQVFCCCGFYLFGYWFKGFIDTYSSCCVVILISVICFITAFLLHVNINLMHSDIGTNPVSFCMGTLGGAVGLLGFSKLFENKNIKVIRLFKYLGRNSLYIFGLHWPLINVVYYLIPENECNLIFSFFLTLIMILFSIFFGKLIQHISFGLLPQIK